MTVTELGMTNSPPPSPVQPENALSGILVTFSPIIKSLIFPLPVIPLLRPKEVQFVALNLTMYMFMLP